MRMLAIMAAVALLLSGCGGATGDLANYFAKCAAQPANCN